MRVDIDIHWEGARGRSKGTLNDININGCFVLCSGAVKDGEGVKVEIELPQKKMIVFRGEVVNHLDEIGFGMKFIDTGQSETRFLKRLIEYARNKQSVS